MKTGKYVDYGQTMTMINIIGNQLMCTYSAFKPKVKCMYFLLPFRGDVAYFDGLIETILAVGLVKPKQGM